ncbi:MAG TPA: ASPIC/UnbV domain-containing protein, partial [Chitinophagales bacterium]|nr:ASPIC/UnbV domain-containing protein [Chitinophagales bacterium]
KGVGATLIAGSNFSAIGAIVRIKANIHGETKWQMRELSAQNSFNSMLSLQAEFGLGDAASIDSLIVEWPSGIIDYCGSLSANHFYTMFEGACPEDIVSINNTTNNISFSLSHNPVSDRLTVLFEVSEQTPVTISITDSAGKNVVHQSYANLPSGENMINLQLNNLAAGVYYCHIVQGQQHATKLFTKQ